MREFVITNDKSRKRAAFMLMEKTRMDIREFMLWRGSIVQKDLISFTPPRGKHPGSETWPQQKKMGEKTIRRDLRRSFQPIDKLQIYLNPTNVSLGNSLRNAVAARNVSATEEILKRARVPFKAILTAPSKAIHNLARNQRGVVKRKQGWMVFRESELKKLEKEIIPDVGKAKGGWIPQSNPLSPKGIPQWVRRHAGPGVVTTDLKGPVYRITWRNGSTATKGMDQDEIVGAVLAIQGRKMMKELKAKLAWQNKK